MSILEANGRMFSGRMLATILLLGALLWGVHFLWLSRDVQPPVWDMALHQQYALNFLQPQAVLPWYARTGNYPPFVHWTMALCELIFHPAPKIAILANIPATLLLLWAIYVLAADLAGTRAALWACVFVVLTPYLIWMSRETVLDYWLAAWVAVGLVVLRRTEGFRSHVPSLLFGLICGLGLLTKWFYAAFLFFPLLQVFIRHRIWRDPKRMLHLADAGLVAGLIASVWYLPNLGRLTGYYLDNAQIGALEGEPPVLSFQSLIYYLRLLEGYQLFALLFVVVVLSVFFVLQRRLLRDPAFLWAAVCGGWLAMTLVRTKDPRFTMPLLAPLMIFPAAWLQSWSSGLRARAVKACLVALLGLQAYAANFGIRWLPQEVRLMSGYTGSVRWDWNLYLQNYFHVLGAPRREDWRVEQILRTVAGQTGGGAAPAALALIPDLPRFNAANFTLMARLRGLPVLVTPLRGDTGGGIRGFEGFQYVVMTEGDQGMSWTTGSSRSWNQIIVDDPITFRLVETYALPDGNCARLYSIQHKSAAEARRRTTRIGPSGIPAEVFP